MSWNFYLSLDQKGVNGSKSAGYRKRWFDQGTTTDVGKTHRDYLKTHTTGILTCEQVNGITRSGFRMFTMKNKRTTQS